MTISDSAVEPLKSLNKVLRISVRGGGCSGLSYDMQLVDTPLSNDKVFSRDGVAICLDPKSYIYLKGSQLAYEDGLTQAGFKIQNPNVKSSCGCGESFSV